MCDKQKTAVTVNGRYFTIQLFGKYYWENFKFTSHKYQF